MIKQIGNTNINNLNNHGIVNIYPSRPRSSTLADKLACNKFSQSYYQLIVTSDQDWMSDSTIAIPTTEALLPELVPAEIYKRCSNLSHDGIKELKTFPLIVCSENTGWNGVTDSGQMAAYAYVNKITRFENVIKVQFSVLSAFNQTKLCEFASDFGLNMGCAMTDLNFTGWSVRRVNLFQAFSNADIFVEEEQVCLGKSQVKY